MSHFVNLFGVGLGPFNLGLAALVKQQPQIKSVFVDKKKEFNWHQGLLIQGTTLQVPYLADLVTIADPTHPMSFLNYLHLHDRLYSFLYLDHSLPFRNEYNHYCQWVARQLDCCHFGEELVDLYYEPKSSLFKVETLKDGERLSYDSQHVAIGIGTQPYIPPCFLTFKNSLIGHSSDFLTFKNRLKECQSITVVGGGQSAAECVLALLSELTSEKINDGAHIQWITRSPGFHPMEFSKLGQECFTPAYMNYFQQLTRDSRHALAANQSQLYKGISFTTIADIYDVLYEQSIGGKQHGLRMFSSTEVINVDELNSSRKTKFGLTVTHRDLNKSARFETEAVILATGYKHVWPEWFDKLKETILVTDDNGDYVINENFCLERQDGGLGHVFLQNSEITHQGVGSPDLGIGAYRNAIIINRIMNKKVYYVSPPAKTAFQSYGFSN